MNIETKIYLDKFKPRDYQLPILDAIENKGYKRVLAIMPRRCLSGNSHIIMSNGSFKLLKDIQKEDSIMSWDGAGFGPDLVKNIWQTETRITYKLSSRYYPGVTSSNEHSFASIKPGVNSITFTSLGSLNTWDCVLHYGGVSPDSFGCRELSALEAELCGYLLSPECRIIERRISFSCPSRAVIERVESVIEQLFDMDATWRESCGIFTVQYGIATAANWMLFHFMHSMGFWDGKGKVDIPEFIWNLSRKSAEAVVISLLRITSQLYEQSTSASPYLKMALHCSAFKAWNYYWFFRKCGFTPLPPRSHMNDLWHIEFRQSLDLGLILSLGLFYGQEEIQSRIKEWEQEVFFDDRKMINGCYYEPFTVEAGISEELWDIETETHGNFVANGYLVHNSGKDITAFNLAIRQCLRKSCVVYYIFPTYSQAKKVIWDSITNEGRRILDFIPSEVVSSQNSQEMKIRFKNGSLLQLVGSDNVDSLVGTNPQACIFSEYALQDPRAYQFIRPILTANEGWALFLSTPRGKNNLWDLYQIAQNSPLWFCYKLTIDDTQHISLEEIERERQEGIMSEDLIQQEYYTSFLLGVEGSYYSKYLDKMRLNNQIGHVPWEPGFKVHTSWDLGVRDSTSIIFFQTIGQTVRFIDCYENSKEGLEHYIKVLKEKEYLYGKHIAPHDIRVKEFALGMTRLEKARQLGITFTIAPNIPIVDGIEAVRTTLPKCWIDEQKCKKLINAIENYRQEYDHKRKVYRDCPLHDFASHFADCLRYLCISLPKTRDGASPEELDKRYKEALYGDQASMPAVFRDPTYDY